MAIEQAFVVVLVRRIGIADARERLAAINHQHELEARVHQVRRLADAGPLGETGYTPAWIERRTETMIDGIEIGRIERVVHLEVGIRIRRRAQQGLQLLQALDQKHRLERRMAIIRIDSLQDEAVRLHPATGSTFWRIGEAIDAGNRQA